MHIYDLVEFAILLARWGELYGRSTSGFEFIAVTIIDRGPFVYQAVINLLILRSTMLEAREGSSFEGLYYTNNRVV